MPTPIGGGIDGPNYSDFIDTADQMAVAAASTAMRQILHLFKDTNAQFITDLAGKTQVYNTHPDNPTLMPLVQLRKSLFVSIDASGQQVEARFQSFINKLPIQLRAALLNDMKLPADQRDPQLAIFEDLLHTVTQVSVWASNINAANAEAPNEVSNAAWARVTTAAKNGVEVLQNTHDVMKAEQSLMPPGDPNEITMSSYLSILAKFITAAKEMIRAMEVAYANKQRDFSVAQRELAQQWLDDQMNLIHKAQEAAKEQATFSLVMKITGPIIGALFLLGTILSGGTLLTIGLALVTTVLGAVDSATGFMTSGIQKLMSNLPPGYREAVTIVLIVVIAIAAKGAGASKIACQLTPSILKKGTEEATKEAVDNSAKMVAMLIGMTLATSSGVITSICNQIAKACCKDDKESQILSMILQLLCVLLLAIFCGKYMGNVGTEKATMLCDIISDSLSVGTKAFSAFNHVRLGMLSKERDDIKATITLIEAAMESFQISTKEFEKTRKNFEQEVKLWSDLFNTIINEGSRVTTALAQAG